MALDHINSNDLRNHISKLPLYASISLLLLSSINAIGAKAQCLDRPDAVNVAIDWTEEISGIFASNNTLNSSDAQTVELYDNIELGSDITCSGDKESCYIQCDGKSCLDSAIITTDTTISNLIIECLDEGSCYGATLSISDSSISFINIICNASRSCKSMQISFEHSSVNDVQIDCNGDESCSDLQITTNDLISSQQLTLKCYSDNSCTSLTYNGFMKNIQNIALLCLSPYACTSAMIDINATNNGQLGVFCTEPQSCDGVEVDSNHDTMIYCLVSRSCDNFTLTANAETNTNFIAYEWSDEVHIMEHPESNLNITCSNENNPRYLRHDTTQTAEEVIDSAKNVYGGHFPCDGIMVHCSLNPDDPRYCEYQYQLNEDVLDFPTAYVECIWLDIADIFSIGCFGECVDNSTVYTSNLEEVATDDSAFWAIGGISITVVILVLICFGIQSNKEASNATVFIEEPETKEVPDRIFTNNTDLGMIEEEEEEEDEPAALAEMKNAIESAKRRRNTMNEEEEESKELEEDDVFYEVESVDSAEFDEESKHQSVSAAIAEMKSAIKSARSRKNTAANELSEYLSSEQAGDYHGLQVVSSGDEDFDAGMDGFDITYNQREMSDEP